MLAGARDARLQEAAWERIGLRAIFASLGAVALLTVVTFTNMRHDDDDASVRSLAQIENVPLS